jgi:hypothetical protein
VITFGATQLFDGYLTEVGITHTYDYSAPGHTAGHTRRVICRNTSVH